MTYIIVSSNDEPELAPFPEGAKNLERLQILINEYEQSGFRIDGPALTRKDVTYQAMTNTKPKVCWTSRLLRRIFGK